MAFFVRRLSRSKRVLMSDMNVTPMIDVMLVLLVIFMVTAPLLTVGVKVKLPTANAPNVESSNNDKPIVVHLNSQGSVFIGNIQVDVDTLTAKLIAIADGTDPKIFVKGDKSLPYGIIMEAMGKISAAGFKHVILVTELPKKRGNVLKSNESEDSDKVR